MRYKSFACEIARFNTFVITSQQINLIATGLKHDDKRKTLKVNFVTTGMMI